MYNLNGPAHWSPQDGPLHLKANLTQPLPRTSRPSVIELFISQAQVTPDAPAIVEDDRIRNYRELLCAARRVADTLFEANLGVGSVVAISGPRGFTNIAAILGTLMARCVFFTIEENAPKKWVEQALYESSASLLLLLGGRDMAPEGIPVAHIDLLELGESGNNQFSLELPLPDDPAYLFFTSGTTGRPKGVLGSHGAMAHFIAWQGETFKVGPADRVAHVTGLSFDVLLREIFLPLTRGAVLKVPGSMELNDPFKMTQWLRTERISLLHTVPTIARVLLDEAEAGWRLPDLRAVFFAGEPLTGQLVSGWRKIVAAGTQIINLYGPTETTLAKCWYEVPPDSLCDNIPVGWPIPESQVLVMAENGSLCDVGQSGEVVIRSHWKSLGYLNAPSPFIRNPFREGADDTIFRTGDRGRFLPNGCLELLGRIDDQVKIRGVRVEPAAITAVLAAHPEVHACSVLAFRKNDQNHLAAFVVSKSNRRQLRQFLEDRLADAMIPSMFCLLESLPKNRNGKIDRKALLRLAETSASSTGTLAETRMNERDRTTHNFTKFPLSQSENLLIEVIRDLLELPQSQPVTPDDDFFDLGGDSLLALSLISRVNQRCGISMDVSDLFESAEIKTLSKRLDALRGHLGTVDNMPFEKAPRTNLTPLSSAQERLWFQCQLEGEQSISYNVPVAVEIKGKLSIEVLQRSLDALMARHEVLRTRFHVIGGVPFQKVVRMESLGIEIVALSGKSRLEQMECARVLAGQQLRRPFALDREPLLTVILLKFGPLHHLLLFNIHHLIFDGWSRWLMIRELSETYAAFTENKEYPLPDLEFQYADFSALKRSAQLREEGVAYWKNKLQGALPLQLKSDRPISGSQCFHGGVVRNLLEESLVEDLTALGRRERVTLYMLLLAGFQVLLGRWSDQEDIVVGSPIANRPRPELEKLLGCFLETLPMRTDLSGNPSFREVLGRVRETVIGSFVNSDIPFERIVEKLNPRRSAGRHPFFDVMFNLVNVPHQTTQIDGLTLSFPELAAPESRYDFTLYARKVEKCVELRLVYKTSLFEAERMERFLAEFIALLRHVVANPDLAIGGFQQKASTPPCSCRKQSGNKEPARQVDPRNGEEAAVASILSGLLKKEAVSVFDNFFSLGGHSLLAAQAVSRINRCFSVNIPLRTIFEHQTVAELVRAIAGAGERQQNLPAPDRLISPGQRRLLDYQRENPGCAHYNVPRMVFLQGELDVSLLKQSVRWVIERHEILRTVYPEEKGQITPRIVDDKAFQFTEYDLSMQGNPTEELDQLIKTEIELPFDLANGPILRASLARMTEHEHAFLITVHHVTADCFSMGMPFGDPSMPATAWLSGVFFRDIWHCYTELHACRKRPANPLKVQYADIISEQDAWLASEEANTQLNYWRNLLSDAPLPLEITPEQGRPGKWDFKGERLPFTVNAFRSEALHEIARRHNTTLFVVLYALFSALLKQWSGVEDQVIGTTAANRSHWGAEDHIGFFSNNLTLRLQLSNDLDFIEILNRAGKSAFSSFSHQELPFEKILKALDIAVPCDRHPLFQIRFLLHYPYDKAFDSGALRLVPVATGREVAKYDLSLLISDRGETLEGWLEYATSLYRRKTAMRMLEDYQHLIDAVIANPFRPISKLWRAR